MMADLNEKRVALEMLNDTMRSIQNTLEEAEKSDDLMGIEERRGMVLGLEDVSMLRRLVADMQRKVEELMR